MIRGFSSVLSKNNIALIRFLQPINGFQAASIVGKTALPGGLKRPPPFPYETKKLRFFHRLLDDMLKRFNENTKLLVVEGNIGAGKSSLAKKLADELDMLHIPEATVDSYYINEYGVDFRQYDDELPEGAKSCSIHNYYENPSHRNVAKFQLRMYMIRFLQYVDALCHIMNTGQGVVMERCVYSDIVFLETMRKFNYVSKGVHNYYSQLRNITLPELLRPHLVIYLDVPADIVLERIKSRNIDYEVKSKVLTKEYVTTLEDEYRKYLNGIGEHAELLVYDWSTFGDVEVVVEDVERIDFDKYDKYDPKLRDWRILEMSEWNDLRIKYTNEKYLLNRKLTISRFDVPEVLYTPEESGAFHALWDAMPGNKYLPGYNMEVGDKKLLFKNSLPIRIEE